MLGSKINLNPWRLYLPIGGKILLFFFIIISIIGGGFYYYTMNTLLIQLHTETQKELHGKFRGVWQIYHSRMDTLSEGMLQTVNESSFQRAVLDQDKLFLKSILNNYAILRPYVDLWVIVDENQKVIGRKNDSTGDIFDVNGIVSHALKTKEIVRTTEMVRRELLAKENIPHASKMSSSGLMQLVVTPLIVKNKSKGAIITGMLLNDSLWISNSSSEAYSVLSAIFINDTDESRIISSSNQGNDIFSSLRILPKNIYQAISYGNTYEGRIILNDYSAYVIAKPISNLFGKVIGGMVLGVPEDEFNFMANRIKKEILLLVSLGIFVSLILAGFAYRTTIKSVKSLTTSMDRIANGDFTTKVQVNTKDELEHIAEGLNEMIGVLKTKQKSSDRYNELSKILISSLEPEYLLKNALIKIIEMTGSQAGIVYLFNDKTGYLEPNSSYGINEADLKKFKVGDGLVGVCASKRNTMLINPITEECYSLETGIVKIKPKAVALFPLIFKSRLIGVLNIGTIQNYTKEDMQDLEHLASHLSIAIDNSMIHKEVELLSTLDGLTGLNNRRHFFDLFAKEFSKARRYKYPISVILMDIDNFKQINDHYGHQVGDNVLKGLGDLLRRQTRETDIWARYGGEEIIGCLHCSKEDAQIVAEKIRQSVESTEFPGLPDKVTISVGVSSCPGDKIKDKDELILYADKRLYYAKENGKNMVVI